MKIPPVSAPGGGCPVPCKMVLAGARRAGPDSSMAVAVSRAEIQTDSLERKISTAKLSYGTVCTGRTTQGIVSGMACSEPHVAVLKIWIYKRVALRRPLRALDGSLRAMIK